MNSRTMAILADTYQKT